MQIRDYYYHAGIGAPGQGAQHPVHFSDRTRRSLRAAVAEAKRMERKAGPGWVGFVEYWSRKHGLRPGDADVVAGTLSLKEAEGLLR